MASLIDQRVAEVLESDAVKESLQARLNAERKVRVLRGICQAGRVATEHKWLRVAAYGGQNAEGGSALRRFH